MGIYSDKLCETVPVVKRMLRKKSEMICCNIEIEQWMKRYYDVEYLKPVWDYLESREENIYDKCYFLVTDEEAIGVKAAFAVLNFPLFEEEMIGENSQDEDGRFGRNEIKSEKSITYLSARK